MKEVTLIWDFDGTLVESYQIINHVLKHLYKTFNFTYDEKFVNHYIIEFSVNDLLLLLSRKYGTSLSVLKDFFKKHHESKDNDIKLMPYDKGVNHFIITHKGETTHSVLNRLGISSYFTEVITSASGFKRKPDPESTIYLIEKYHLDRKNTYYVGDRPLDLDLAINANIKSINLN